MIRFSDLTIIEADGDFKEVCKLMAAPRWMIETSATIECVDGNVSSFMLHMWHDGLVSVFETNRPFDNVYPDTDFIELKEWMSKNGWSRLTVDGRLLVNPRHYKFWKFKYDIGVIESDTIDQREAEEKARLEKLLKMMPQEEEEE